MRDKRLRDPTIAVTGILADVTSGRNLKDKPFDFGPRAVMRLSGFAPSM